MSFFIEVKRARRPRNDKFILAIQQCMMKIEMTIKPALKKVKDSKAADLREVRHYSV